ncbi:TPA: hypothetical protein ACH3X3_006625 [Trebouxia sp. C0006]
MALQAKDLLSSALGGNLTDLQEVHLSHKGLEDITAIGSAPNVVNVNVSFNKLATLDGVQMLSQLQLLDLSHNKVKSLKPLSSLAGLQVLKASHNKITQLASLATCTSLRELWLQHNQIASHSQLLSLATLPSLAVLFLAPNPVCDSLKDNHRAAAISAISSLQVLDGQAVSEADRTAAAAYSTQQAQMPSADSSADSAAVLEQDTTLSPAASLRTGRAAAAALPSRAGVPSSPQKGPQTLRTKSTGLRQKKSGEIDAVGRVTGQRTGSSDMSTGFESIEGQLPKFDIDKHGNRLDKPLDPYGTATLRGTSKLKDSGPVETVYQSCYGHTSQHQAIIVRSDGSAVAQYPMEGVAVSVDPDNTGGKKGGMRLLATYRSTGLAAVMFEADGTGSVQYPNGNLWMSFTAETGKGALYSHAGEVTRTWSSEAEEPIELVLDQHLGFCYHQRQPVVYFACEGQMQRFVQGQNPGEHVWDNASDAPAPAFLQELVDKNRAASFPVGIPDASSGLQGTIAQPVTGPSLNQFSAITAALQALQASMTTMLPQSASAQENEPSVDNQATDSSAD